MVESFNKVRANLYKYQAAGVQYMLEHNWVLLGDEQGLGKSLQAITVMAETGLRSIVVCPGSLRATWKKEIERFTDLSVDVVTSSRYPVHKARYDVLILSYELAHVIQPEYKPDIMVLDEVQYIKNVKSKRAQYIHELAFLAEPQFVLALSGTPIKNNVTEFYSVLKLLSYCPQGSNGMRIQEKSEYAFSLKFSDAKRRKINVVNRQGEEVQLAFTEFKGVKNIPKLKSYLRGKYIRRTAKHQLDLPPLINKKVNFGEQTGRLQQDLFGAFEDWLLTGSHGSHITQLKVSSAMEKVPNTSLYATDLVGQGEKVVIFSDHVQPIVSIADTLTKKKIKVGMVHGGVPAKKRQDRIEGFQSGEIQVLLCTIGAASTGLTLTASKNLIFNDMSWVPADNDQARKRIHRIGQKGTCIIHLMLQGDIDERIADKILEKSKLLRKIL